MALVASLATFTATRIQQQQRQEKPGSQASGGSGGGGGAGGSVKSQRQRYRVSDRAKARSLTRKNPDGTVTTTLFAAPVRYRDRDGKWRRIDSSLVQTGGGPYRWHNAGNSFDARFKESPDEDFLRFEAAGAGFTFTAEGADDSTAEVDGATVHYPDAFGDADLSYTVTATGVKEDIVLPDADAPTRYTFRLSAPERGPPLSAQRRDDGSWAFFRGPRLEPVFVLPAPTVTEATGKRQAAPPDPDAKPKLTVKRDGRDFTVEVSISEKWLTADERRFPVRIDPTITIQPDVQDAEFVSEPGFFINANEQRIAIGGDDKWNWRSSVMFDLGAVPADATVTGASLNLFYDLVCLSTSAGLCNSSPYTLDAHRMTVPWDASSASQDMDFDPTVLDSYVLDATASSWMTWNVTDTVTSWLDGTQSNFGFLVKMRTEALQSSGPAPPAAAFTGGAEVKPKLEVTYESDAVKLFAPDTLHSDGAELQWSSYGGTNPFSGYEVHRGRQADFTPSPSTLLTTIQDQAVTSYRDTTAAPDTKFTYRIVTNGDPSPPRTVTLPPDGQATKDLQLAPADGESTLIFGVEGSVNCANYGVVNRVDVGTQVEAGFPEGRLRGLVRFDLHDIPPGATITAAELQLWKLFGPDVPLTVEAHRATRAWKEGTGDTECTGDGATWYETESGQPWTSEGGDFDSTVVDNVAVAADELPRFHQYQITNVVQQWVSGDAPNHGLVFKISDETLQAGKRLSYASDDYTASPALRPKLTLTYADGSHAAAPEVAISDPTDGAQVLGITTVRAAANDDRRVDQVTFLVDGQQAATDTTAPFGFDWDTSAVPNGAHTLAARAVDDAGNTTTSGAVSVNVQNSATPTVALTAPADAATVAGAVTVAANATDDEAVDRVEFLADGHLIGAPDTSAPYQISWDTLDPRMPAYDGPHQLTAVVYDNDGQQTTSAPVNVTVANTAGTKYQADLTTSPLPPTAEYDPAPGAEQLTYGVDATITNTSDTTLPAADTAVGYRWFSPDDPPTETSDTVALGSDLPPGGSTTVQLDVPPPALPEGTDRATYRLMIDLRDTATAATWFSAKGNPPPRGRVEVTKKTFVGLGLEQYYTYPGAPLGAGMEHLVNAASGNSLLAWTPMTSAGRGLSTVVGLTYNSLEDHSKSPAGNNFSLSMSGLTRLGARLDIHPNKADEISGRSNKWVSFLDGDGTLHRFDGTTQPDGTTTWQEPAGVDLYLRHTTSTDPNKAWALTRPDNVTFYFTENGYPTQVVDRNGNALTFTLADVPPGEDPGGPKKRITTITDPGGRSYEIDYYSKKEAHKPQIRGKIQRVTDHSGHALVFDYYHDGNLLRVTETGGTNADGTPLADRAFVFTYYNNAGDAPAIATKADRIDPDPKTPNQSVRLYSVWSPRDVAAGEADGRETTFTYLPASAGPDMRWRLASRTGRDGQTTTFTYDTTARTTTVAAPLTRSTTFHWDATGLVRRIVDPLAQSTYQTWTGDRQLAFVTDPTTGPAADAPTQTFTYNANGMLTSATNQAGERTELTYRNFAADAADPGQHLSLLTRRVNPKGVASRQVAPISFVGADVDKGNWSARSVTVPAEVTAGDGLLLFLTINRNDVTISDPTGVDGWTAVGTRDTGSAVTKVWRKAAEPSDGGQQVTVNMSDITKGDLLILAYHGTDPANPVAAAEAVVESTVQAEHTTPAINVATAGSWVVSYWGEKSSATTSWTAPDGQAVRSTSCGSGGGRICTLATDSGGPVPAGAAGGLTATADSASRHATMWSIVLAPQGATATTDDFTYDFGYDTAGNLTKVTFPPNPDGTRDAATNTYNPNGTLATTTDPRSNTTRFTAYDPSGQPTVITDAAGRTTRIGYDADGRVTFIQDPLHAGESTTPWDDPRAALREYATVYDYDSYHRVGRVSTPKSTRYARGQLIWSSRVFDAHGNVTAAGQPAYGIGDPGLAEATRTSYDAMDRPTVVTGPDTTADPDGERTAYSYDAAGRLIEVVTPRGMATTTVGDHIIEVGYDKLDRRVSMTRRDDDGQAVTTQAGYDTVGDLTTVTTPENHVTTMGYDPAHRLTSVTDPENRVTRQAYDANGNVTEVTDQASVTTRIGYDQRDRRIKTVRPHTDTRDLVTQWAYDANGNVTTVIPPRAFDAAGGTAPYDQYVTNYSYNQVNELTRVAHPTSTAHPQATYTHRRYDAGGQLDTVTLPTTAASLDLVPAEQQTALTRFDPGWIRSSDDHVNPALFYDHTAQGWQTSRTPTGGNGELDAATQMLWTYHVDGTLASRSDRGGQVSTYTYNPGNQLIEAVDGGGITDPDQKPREIHLTWDALDRLAATYHRPAGAGEFTATSYRYDPDGNLIRQRLDGTASTAGGSISGGRRAVFTYDTSGRLDRQVDYGTSTGCSDDRRIDSAFTPTGLPSSLTIRASTATLCLSGDEATDTPDAAVWDDVKQTTTKTYYHNQQLKTLTTKDRGGAVVESHDLAYTDTGGVYVGTRTRDEFLLDHPNSTACAATTCTATWTYDPRGRLTQHTDGHGGTTTYTLDPAGNITEQTTPQGTTTRSYTGNRLTTATTGTQTFDYFYDPLGNLDCITTGAGTHNTCNTAEGATVPSELVTDHSYDYLDRLASTRSYNAGTLTDKAEYVYDALDRVVKETDNHPTKNLSRVTDFTYQGLSNQVAQEQISTDKADRTEDETKTYLYDVLGRRITMHHQKDTTLDAGGGTSEDARYTYGHDPQASVSLLLDDGTGTQGPNAESVKATYGYTPYGQADDTLTKGDTQQLQPINPFRFIGKYHDPGTGSVDMGARRYTPDLGRFFQQDRYHGALANLGLTLDPLTGNRYAYAAGRPVGYVEIDGHCFGRDYGDLCPTEDIDKQWQADPIPKNERNGSGGSNGGSGSGGGASAGSRDLPDVQRCPPTPEPTLTCSMPDPDSAPGLVAPPIVAPPVPARPPHPLGEIATKIGLRALGWVALILSTCGDTPDAAGCQNDDEDYIYAVGGSPNGPSPGPRPKRAGADYEPGPDGAVLPQGPPRPRGQSAYRSLRELRAQVGGHVWRLPGDTPLPEGLAMYGDGVDVGGDMPPGHITIYATRPMSVDEFIAAVNQLGWQYVGKY